MKIKTRTQIQHENELLDFYAKKAKEKTGGVFFKLFKDGQPGETIWGRDFSDAAGAAQESQKHNRKFSSFNQQVPGNVQFTKIVRLF
jgi:hypothetical protein